MSSKQKLKKLAQIAATSKNVPDDIEAYVLTCLTTQEIKTFLRFYKIALSKNRVYVTSSTKISDTNLDAIRKNYIDKEIITILDEDLGAGIKLQHDDLVVDFTFKNYINDSIEKLKN